MSLLQQAERWLADQASSNRGLQTSSTPCPGAEELFDFGRGPGATELGQGVERRIQAHLVDCAECRGLVATLATRPPAPLLDLNPEAEAKRERAAPIRPQLVEESLAPESLQIRPAAKNRWLSYAAAAAAVLGAAYLWNVNRTSHGAKNMVVAQGEPGIGFPELATLRGDSASALHYPSGKVLGPLAGATLTNGQRLRFEIDPRPDASAYAVKLSRAGVGAFGKDELLAKFDSPTAELELAADVARKLSAGSYSWEAWARVDGLDRPLGKCGFQLVEDFAARDELERDMLLPEPARSTAILKLLVEREFKTDAHAYASGLPPSPERNKFLLKLQGL